MKEKKITISLFSDTHGFHGDVNLPEADISIFAGDAGTYKNPYQNKSSVLDFIEWYSSVPNIKHKIWIAGNHCTSIEAGLVDAKKLSEKGLIYLEDETIEIDGLKIFGSPWSPWFYSWAFNAQRGEEIKKHWDKIGNDVDIIIAHGPVKGILDECMDGGKVGCLDLLNKVNEVKPICVIGGHIHEAYGHKFVDDVHYFNASVLNHNYKMTNNPIIIEIEGDDLKIIEL